MTETEWTPAQLFALRVRDGLDSGERLAEAIWDASSEHPTLSRDVIVAIWWRLEDGSLANALSLFPEIFDRHQVEAVAKFEEIGESRAAVVSLLV